MKKWASISCAFLVLWGNGIPVKAENRQQTIHLYVHSASDLDKPCSAAEYALYQDASAREPLLDETGNAYVIQTDAAGKGELTLPDEPFYLQMKEPSLGYYKDAQIVKGGDDLSLSQWQIRFAFSSGERIPEMQLLQTDGTLIPLAQAKAGGEYTAAEISSSDYHAAKQVKVSVPLYRDVRNDPIYIKTEDQSYGIAKVKISAGGQNIPGVKFEVYADEQCTKKAVDVFGRTVSCCSEEEIKSLSLAAGTWYLKLVDVPASYALLDQVTAFTTEAEKDIDVEVMLQKIMLTVNVVDALTGQQVKADVTCVQAESSVQDHTYAVERNQTYEIHAEAQDPGYFQIGTERISIPNDTDQKVNVMMQAVPFAVHVHGIDADAGNDVAMKYEIRSTAGEILDCIHAGDTVIFHETECESGYQAAPDQKITIPAVSSQPMNYDVAFLHVPFVVTAVSAPAGTKVSLYTDAECTAEAQDLYGQKATRTADVSGTVSFALRNGTYYAKQDNTAEGYCPDTGILTLEAQRSASAFLQSSFHNQRIALKIFSTAEGKPLSGVTYEVKEKGSVIQTISGNGEDILDHDLLAGHTYEINVADIAGQYLYQSRKTAVISSAGEVQPIQFDFIPYTDLMLNTDCAEEAAGALYLDSQCTQKAKDVHGNLCDLQLSLKASMLQMSPGTYWFCNDASSHYYRKVTQITINPDEKAKTQTITLTSADVLIEILNEDSHGHTMELRDKDGHLIKTWKSKGKDEEVPIGQLEPGKDYVIEDKDSKQKTMFTMPEDEPDQTPVVKVQQKDAEETVMTQKEVPNVMWMIGGMSILLFGTCGGLLMYHKRNENVFK